MRPGKLLSLNATLVVRVEYEVITSQIVRKRIRFHQVDMYMLFCQVANSLEPLEPPAKFWSFNQEDCQGGALREYDPAAGFRTKTGDYAIELHSKGLNYDFGSAAVQN